MQIDILAKIKSQSPITGKFSKVKAMQIPSFQDSVQSKENANNQNSTGNNMLSSNSFHSYSEKKSYLQKNPKTNLIDFVSPTKIKGNFTTKEINENYCEGFEEYVSSLPIFSKKSQEAGSIQSLEDIPEQNNQKLAVPEQTPIVMKNQSRKISVFNPQRANTQEFENLQKIQPIRPQPPKIEIERNIRKRFMTLKLDFQNPTKNSSLQMIDSFNDSFVHTPTLTKIIDEDGNQQINQYLVLKKLGQGAFGKVKLAKNMDTEQKFAIKISNKKKLKKKIFGQHGETAYNKLQKEIAIMKSLCHPNIVNLYEVIDDPEQNKLYLIMEYVQKGCIFSKAFNLSIIEKNKDLAWTSGITEEQAKKYFGQLSLGLDYLHNHANVIHRDIKPDNILIDADDNVKIADFGISELLENKENKCVTNASGTKVFLAPEIWKMGKIQCQGKPLDVWAAGVTLFYMIFKKYPYFSRDVSELQQKIIHEELEYPWKISNELMDLFSKCLEKDPNKRITINEILKHDWLTNNGQIELKNDFDGEFEISENKIEQAFTKKQTINNNNNNNSDENLQFQV